MKFNTMEELAEDVKEEYSCRLDDLDCDIPFWEYSLSSVNDNLDMIFENFENLGDYLKREEIDYLLYSVKLPNVIYSNRVDDFMQRKYSELMEEVAALESGIVSSEKVSLVCLEDVKEEETRWLYSPYVPRGKLTLCAAYPGTGKTYLLCYMAACVTTGKSFFNIVPFEHEGENVIYLTAEDGIGDTIKKRMRQCGANMKKVFVVTENKTQLLFDSPEIEEFVKEKRPALMVFDPFQAYIGSDVDMNAPNKTNERVGHIVDLAEKYNVAMILICHFNKNSKGDAITRVLGSTDIMGKCRSYVALGNVPDDEEMKFMSHEKSSLEKRGKTVLFEIDPDNGGIVYKGENCLSMDDYTAIRNKKRVNSAPALEEAKKFIVNQMPEGRRMAKEIKNLAAANKISNMTLQRARDDLGIIVKTTKTFPAQTEWILPGHGEEKLQQETLPL